MIFYIFTAQNGMIYGLRLIIINKKIEIHLKFGFVLPCRDIQILHSKLMINSLNKILPIFFTITSLEMFMHQTKRFIAPAQSNEIGNNRSVFNYYRFDRIIELI